MESGHRSNIITKQNWESKEDKILSEEATPNPSASHITPQSTKTCNPARLRSHAE